MKRKFVTNLIFLLLLNLLVKPFWIFGIERTVQNIVGASEFGFYFSLFSFSMMLNILLDVGITNYNNRNISQNHHLLGKYVSHLITLKLLLAVFYAVVSISLALLLGYSGRQLDMLYVLIFNQFLLSFILYLRSNISGLQLFKTDSMMSVLDRFLMILICGYLIWGRASGTAFQIEWFVYAQTASYLLTALTCWLIVMRKTHYIRIRCNYKQLLVFLRQSYPFALLTLLMSLYYRVDSVMLERLLVDGKEQAGIYAQAFRIMDASGVIAYLFAVLLLPMFSRMLKLKENVEELVKTSAIILIVPAIFLSMSCHLFNYRIMDLLYNELTHLSAPVLSVLMAGFMGLATTYITGTLLTANNSLKLLNKLALGGFLINIILNFILIPDYGALGSAIASMSTQIFIALTQLIYVSRLFQFKFNTALILRFAGFILVSYVSIKVFDYLFTNWIYAFLSAGALCVLFAWLIGMFRIKDILKRARLPEQKQ